MSHSTLNPYESPQLPAKLTTADAADIKRRDIATFVLLNLVTLGIYWFYIVYQWAKEVNGIVGRVKYQPVMVLIVSIVSCGIAGFVFECLFAFDVAQAAKDRGTPGRLEPMPTWVIGCNVAGMVLSLIPFGFLIGLPLGILASVLLQVELNKLAENYGR